MSYSITDKQIVELYFYKFHARLVGINVMNDTNLEWFNDLGSNDKKALLDNINHLCSSLSVMPIVDELPLADKLEDSILAKNRIVEQMQLEQEERERRITEALGKTQKERIMNLKKLFENNEEEEIKRIYGIE